VGQLTSIQSPHRMSVEVVAFLQDDCGQPPPGRSFLMMSAPLEPVIAK
jgi:hypothetical protein